MKHSARCPACRVAMKFDGVDSMECPECGHSELITQVSDVLTVRSVQNPFNPKLLFEKMRAAVDKSEPK